MYEKMLQLLRSYRERSLTTQKFDRGRGKMVPKAAFAKAVFTRRFRICRWSKINKMNIKSFVSIKSFKALNVICNVEFKSIFETFAMMIAYILQSKS
jgi:hypothetical protein